MRITKIFGFLLIAICSTPGFSSERNILFLQQEEPGHIIFVSMNERGKQTIVNVEGMGAATIKKKLSIDTSHFSQIWDLANSKE